VVQHFATDIFSQQYRNFKTNKALPEAALNSYAALGWVSLNCPRRSAAQA